MNEIHSIVKVVDGQNLPISYFYGCVGYDSCVVQYVLVGSN